MSSPFLAHRWQNLKKRGYTEFEILWYVGCVTGENDLNLRGGWAAVYTIMTTSYSGVKYKTWYIETTAAYYSLASSKFYKIYN